MLAGFLSTCRGWPLISTWGFLPDRPVNAVLLAIYMNGTKLTNSEVCSVFFNLQNLTVCPIARVYCKTDKQQCVSIQVDHWLPGRGTYDEHNCSSYLVTQMRDYHSHANPKNVVLEIRAETWANVSSPPIATAAFFELAQSCTAVLKEFTKSNQLTSCDVLKRNTEIG